jgi:cytochrome b561
MNNMGISRYSKTAMLLHWIIAILIVTNYVLYYVAESYPEEQRGAYMMPHMSIGISVLALSLFRLFWRLGHKPPALPSELAGWQAMLSKSVHLIFYVLIIAIPITGWLMVSAHPKAPPVSYFGLFDLDLPFGKSKALSGIGHEGHEILGKVLYGVLALHVIGALKHQFTDRMPFIQRMWPS